MPSRQLRLVATDGERLRAGLDQIRAELEVPGEFPAEARAEASAAALAGSTPDRDLTDLPFVTIDPPSSMDLDQAVHLSRDGSGFLVRYAIADVTSFVTPGGPIDVEAHRRGVTFYGPDRRAPLHPVELSEGAASLLPDQERPALVWQLRLDTSGELTETVLTRARVRSRAKLTYEGVQRDLDAGAAGDMLGLLPEIGRLRLEQERARGGVSMPVPEQEIVTRPDGGYGLQHRSPLRVEAWNAQLSLLTGTAAAALMREGGVGIFRMLPPAQQRDVERLRRTAKALRIDWPPELPYADLIRSLDPAPAAHAAFLEEAISLFRGAGYVAFDGSVPESAAHAAIAAEYAHVTAPLRRLVDRYALEVCAALSAGAEVPQWVRAALPELPEVMAEAGRRASAYEGACVAVVEAAVMTGREGEVFPGVVVDVVGKDDRGEVVIPEPAVRGRVAGRDLPLGEDVSVRLVEASIEARRIAFALA
ncbi:MAG: RNB domain-containing ribonuclease [Jiangellaceae bacterium]